MKFYGKWITKDVNSLEANGNELRVKVAGTGAVERTAEGINVKAASVTSAMLAGSIAFDKLADSANIARLDQAETVAEAWSFSSIPSINVAPTSDNHAVRKKYVDDQIAATGTSAEWQESVIDILADPPATPASGDRYLVDASATGDWVGHDDDIAEWNGTAWVFTTPTTRTNVSADDETDGIYYFGGVSWTKKSFESITAGAGIDRSGSTISIGDINRGIQVNADDIEIDGSEIAGSGLSENGVNSWQLDVNTDGSTIAVNGLDQLGIVDAGVTETQLAASVAGGGLTGGAGSVLAVGAGNGISVAADSVSIDASALISGGASEIDGDQVDIDFTPSNYTPSTDPAEVTSVDHLSAHLAGIDDALAGISTENVKQEMVALTSTDITNGYITLADNPVNATSVRVTPVGGPQQVSKQLVGTTGVTPDFDVLNTNELHINNNGAAIGLSEDFADGDVLMIAYQA